MSISIFFHCSGFDFLITLWYNNHIMEFKINRNLNSIPAIYQKRFLDIADPTLRIFQDMEIVSCIYICWQGNWKIERCGCLQETHINFFWIFGHEMLIESQFGIQKAHEGDLLVVPSWFDRRQIINGAKCPHLYIRSNNPQCFPMYQKIQIIPSRYGEELRDDILRLCTAMEKKNRDSRYQECLAELITILFKKEVYRTESAAEYFKEEIFSCLYSSDNNSITVPELAHAMKMSVSSLYKKCTDFCGVSPQHLLKEYRFRMARQYLLYTQSSLKDIAEIVGYSDVFAFSKAFHNYFGFPPSSYRKQSHPRRTSKSDT